MLLTVDCPRESTLDKWNSGQGSAQLIWKIEQSRTELYNYQPPGYKCQTALCFFRHRLEEK